ATRGGGARRSADAFVSARRVALPPAFARRRIEPRRRKWYTRQVAMATQRTLGVIGGSGLYGLDGLEDVERRKIDTPFGAPSDELLIGRLGDARLVFLPRHGRGHRIL